MVEVFKINNDIFNIRLLRDFLLHFKFPVYIFTAKFISWTNRTVHVFCTVFNTNKISRFALV